MTVVAGVNTKSALRSALRASIAALLVPLVVTIATVPVVTFSLWLVGYSFAPGSKDPLLVGVWLIASAGMVATHVIGASVWLAVGTPRLPRLLPWIGIGCALGAIIGTVSTFLLVGSGSERTLSLLVFTFLPSNFAWGGFVASLLWLFARRAELVPVCETDG